MVSGRKTCKPTSKPDTKRNTLKLSTSIVTDLLALTARTLLQQGETTQFSLNFTSSFNSWNSKVGCTKSFCRANHILTDRESYNDHTHQHKSKVTVMQSGSYMGNAGTHLHTRQYTMPRIQNSESKLQNKMPA